MVKIHQMVSIDDSLKKQLDAYCNENKISISKLFSDYLTILFDEEFDEYG